MPTRAALVEDDAHRVLQLVRGATAATKGKARGVATPSGARHRHVHSTPATTRASLAQAKTRALMAVYGLRHTPPQLPSHSHDGNNNGNNNDDAESGAKEDEALAQAARRELLEARRRTYRDHFSGLQATYGPSGRPKLETLIDAAMDAKRRGARSSKHTSLAVGAAVLTSANRIYAAARVESTQDAKFDVCAERAALLKLLEQRDDGQVVEALVVCSDQRGLLPVPCGACREFLAEFGDFPVFLLNAENDSRETRSFELFPLARHATYTAMVTRQAAETTREDHQHDQSKKEETTPSPPLDARDWTCEQVAAWLHDVVELPQYASVFADKRVDGATLWLLTDADLQLLLGVVHPLHRRRLLLHLDRVRDRALLEHGVDFAQLADYVAVLDRDRLDVVAQLKQTFDRLDANRDGRLDSAELARAMRALGLDASQALAAQQLLAQVSENGYDDGVSFPSFVRTFSQLAQLPAGETRDAVANNNGDRVPHVDLEALRGTFDKADTDASGALDEPEVAALLRSLGRDDCERRAREWFSASVDGDGDGKLTFAEFFLRYAQLTKLDLSVVRGAFDDVSRVGPPHAQRQCTVDALATALQRLFPHVDAGDIRAWCAQRPWASGRTRRTKALAFADFALACVMYGNALRLRVAQLTRLQQTLRNDALCHRSRIVQLQQSGHVRLCTHPGGADGDARDGDVPLGERRRAQLEKEKRKHVTTTQSPRRRRRSDDEAKDAEEKEEEEEEEEARDRVAAIFKRFAKKQKTTDKEKPTSRHRRTRASDDSDRSDDDAKRQHSDEDDDSAAEATLNAVEAAQALLELGVAWSRDQVVRFLDREGFGLRRAIRKRDFERIFTRLRALQKATTSDGSDAHKELWATIGGAVHRQQQQKAESAGKSAPRARTKKDYDAYLRARHAALKQQKEVGETLRGRRRCRDDDMGRARSSRRRVSRSSSTSSSESSEDDRRRARSSRSRQRSHSRRRRRSRSSTSTASSSSTSSSSNSPRRARSRSRSKSRPRAATRPSDRFFRGFEVGDRVVCRARGAGTLVRLYRDYFVADVRFDSGESVKNVDLSHLKRQLAADDRNAKSSEAARRALFVVGATVRVAHKRTRAAWRRGTIQRCRSDGTFDVVANECGEQELLARVPLAQLSLVGKPVVYSSGARVTVKRRREYLRGTVAMCRTNGTYDVRLGGTGDDVLREVAWELLAPDEADGDDEEEEEDDDRKVKKTSTTRASRRKDDDDGKADDDDDAFEDEFEPEFGAGDRVEARFQGQSAYYGGRVTRVHSDGTCDIAYDDGDAESRVRTSLIRVAAPAQKKKATTSLSRRDGDGYDDDFESD